MACVDSAHLRSECICGRRLRRSTSGCGCGCGWRRWRRCLSRQRWNAMQAASGWHERATVEDASDEHSSHESFLIPMPVPVPDAATCDSSTSRSGCANWALVVLPSAGTRSVLDERIDATAAGVTHVSALRAAHRATATVKRWRRTRTLRRMAADEVSKAGEAGEVKV